MTLDQALKILQAHSCLEMKNITSETEKQELQQAILLIIQESDSYNLGICAENSQKAIATLSNYLTAFGQEIPADDDSINQIDKAVYLKFKIIDKSYYLDSYNGDYRGVLISCQGENEKVIGTYGHFPLDLFN